MSAHRELWKVYRPQTFAEVAGQDTAVRMLTKFLGSNSVPHSILFTGPAGSGKSTMARILAKELGAVGLDLQIIDCASIDEPIAAVRELQQMVKSSPSNGSKCRVWILEEIQTWTRARAAERALLLPLENDALSVRRSYIMLCTTNPEKLNSAIRTRCTKVELKPLAAVDVRALLVRIAKKEGREVPDSVYDKIIDFAAGGAREAVNQLNSALASGDSEEEMLAAVSGVQSSSDVGKLFAALFWEPKPSWPKVVKALEAARDGSVSPEKLEGIRRGVLKIAASEMRKGGKNVNRAHLIADIFKDSWEYCPESGLEMCCWEVVQECLGSSK